MGPADTSTTTTSGPGSFMGNKSQRAAALPAAETERMQVRGSQLVGEAPSFIFLSEEKAEVSCWNQAVEKFRQCPSPIPTSLDNFDFPASALGPTAWEDMTRGHRLARAGSIAGQRPAVAGSQEVT